MRVPTVELNVLALCYSTSKVPGNKRVSRALFVNSVLGAMALFSDVKKRSEEGVHETNSSWLHSLIPANCMWLRTSQAIAFQTQVHKTTQEKRV